MKAMVRVVRLPFPYPDKNRLFADLLDMLCKLKYSKMSQKRAERFHDMQTDMEP